jgi:hypothetical protein
LSKWFTYLDPTETDSNKIPKAGNIIIDDVQGLSTEIDTMNAHIDDQDIHTNLNALPALDIITATDSTEFIVDDHGVAKKAKITNSNGSLVAKAIKTVDSDSVLNSTTLTNDPELYLSVKSATYYTFKACLFIVTANSKPQFKFALQLPTGSGSGCMSILHDTGGNNVTFPYCALDYPQSTTSLFPGYYTRIDINGSFHTGSSGDSSIRLQWSQAVSDSNKVTLKAYSYIQIS